ncbi:efflux RND transporter periplasmic adaptor subunit [Flavobacterium sp. W21_SRS_FM6]|uniref:efflux RND transporter periplasmic adaptor subunit n=1 Tax=Flavobacterium sp. W21_SRS_FM6 TaxID=3240268 RepID=UPI003F8E0C38
MKIINTGIGGIVVGSALTFTMLQWSSEPSPADTHEQQPLYWVAPMDANYRRDKPGKSPMGMELVPVFAEQQKNADEGIVKIKPHVVNNLGLRSAKVSRERLYLSIETVGYVQYNEDSLVHIHPRIEGWVDKLYVTTTGQQVSKDEALYALYSPQLVNAQEEFLLAQKRQNTSLIEASTARLLALQMPLKSIEKLAKTNQVQQTVIFTAPQSGVVDNLNIREGFYVKPGTTLLSIGALDEVWVEAEIFERQAAMVKADLSATMTLGFLPGESWHGKLDYIYPTLDPLTRTVRVRLRFDNPQRKLKPNMFAQISIQALSQTPTLVVPREAVIRTGKQDRVVLALGDGQFKSVAVQLGMLSHDKAQILAGLAEGDTIVTSAQFLLDSESSISSDFKRMEHKEHVFHQPVMADMAMADNMNPDVPSAMVNGTIVNIDSEGRILTIARDAIEKWQRPATTMDFTLADHLSINDLAPQQRIHFTFEIHQNAEQESEFIIVKLMIIDEGDSL